MKQRLNSSLAVALALALPLMFTSCDDILGEWNRPTPSKPSTSDTTVRYITLTAELDASTVSDVDLWEVGSKAAVIYDVAGTKKSAEAQVTAVSGKVATVSVSVEEGITNNSQVTVIYPASAADGTTGNISSAAIAAQDGIHTPFALTGKFTLNGTTASLSNIECGDYAICKFRAEGLSGEDYSPILSKMVFYDNSDNLLSSLTIDSDVTFTTVYVTLPLVTLGCIDGYDKTLNKPVITRCGDALTKGFQSVSLQIAKIGDMILSDGTLVKPETAGAQAVIAYIGKAENYFNHFLALALTDADDNMLKWGDTNTDPVTYPAAQAVKSYAHDHAITIYGVVYDENKCYDGTVAPYYYDRVIDGVTVSSARRAENTDAADKSLVKGWRLPSITDWRYILDGICRQKNNLTLVAKHGGETYSSNATPTDPIGVSHTMEYHDIADDDGSTLVTAINSACNNSALHLKPFWSSSERLDIDDGSCAWEYDFVNGSISILAKEEPIYVRAVFAY